jgi:hypothetical protein
MLRPEQSKAEQKTKGEISKARKTRIHQREKKPPKGKDLPKGKEPTKKWCNQNSICRERMVVNVGPHPSQEHRIKFYG